MLIIHHRACGIILSEPDGVDFLHGAICPETIHKCAVLIAQGLSCLRFGKYGSQIALPQIAIQNLQFGSFKLHEAKDCLIRDKVVHLSRLQCGQAIRMVLKIPHLGIRIVFLGQLSADRTG